MTAHDETMTLALFHLPVGVEGAWRRAGSGAEKLYGLELPKAAAMRAEGACLDAVVFGDRLSFDDNAMGPDPSGYDPITTAAALVDATQRIGLVATASTTFTEPYRVARQLSSIDALSRGRAGWNIVTSRVGEENFSMGSLPPAAERYARAEEYLEVVTALWEAWAPDSVIDDRAAGIWADTTKIRRVDHVGRRFSVRGPLNVPRSPQTRPVLMQAGQSGPGQAFAARTAEAIFTVRGDLAAAQAFYASMKAQIRGCGRDPKRIRILPGLTVLVGETEAEAQRLHRSLFDLSDVGGAYERLSRALGGVKLDDIGLDDGIPADRLPPPDQVADGHRTLFFEGSSSRYANFYEAAVGRRLSVRRLMHEVLHAGGYALAVGTVEQVADEMERWFRARACDGFILSAALMPDGLAAICDRLVPELQSRGLFRTEYHGRTLRDHLRDTTRV